MSCDSQNHQMHICALKREGQDELVKNFSDHPTVECRQCGARANSSEYLCAAHLGDCAPNVEGGHGTVGLEDVGKPHEGAAAREDKEPEIAIKQLPVDGICGGY